MSEERPASTEPAKVPAQSDRSALVAHLYTANSRLELELSVARMALDETQSLLRITLFGMTAGLLVILILAALITLSITWRTEPSAPSVTVPPAGTAPPTKPAVTTRKTMGFDPTHNPRAGGNTRNDPTKGPIESPAEPLPSPAKP